MHGSAGHLFLFLIFLFISVKMKKRTIIDLTRSGSFDDNALGGVGGSKEDLFEANKRPNVGNHDAALVELRAVFGDLDNLQEALERARGNVVEAIDWILANDHQEKEEPKKNNVYEAVEDRLTREFLEAEWRANQKLLDEKVYSCGICFCEEKIEDIYVLDDCFHRFCLLCMKEHCQAQISNGNTTEISCPHVGCQHKLSYEEVQQIVATDADTKSKFEAFLIKETLERNERIVWCPKGCGNGVEVEAGDRLAVYCAKCDFRFCRNCQVEWHESTTCEMYREWEQENNEAQERFNEWSSANAKACPNPKCKSMIEKDGGCNHMTCKKCKKEFCWACGKAWVGGNHFCNAAVNAAVNLPQSLVSQAANFVGNFFQ